ncbi:MAG: hypothetical protein SWH78_16855 [Thermodesulfobacteriota bacterium]|nr:hypothetical protein [Thermodesulfobacteriota bacterium]
MNQVLVTVSRGIIAEVVFFHDPSMAIQALSKYVKAMNVEHNDAALYDADGMIANAKHFLDEKDEYAENEPLIAEAAKETRDSIHIIGNPKHRLGFMVVSPDDPLGYDDPAEALSQLGQMRQDFGRHLKLYRVEPVEGSAARREELEKHNQDCDIEDFDYSLVEEYL